MTLQQRKLRKHLTKAIRNEKKIKLYLLNNHWIKIRKQKERRRRRTFLKLWKVKRLQMMKQGFSTVA
jgi:hypothetical protein